MEKIAGFIDHIIYHNSDNGYTVLNLLSSGDEITCVGSFSSVNEGENIEAEGEYVVHPSYGVQFKVRSYELSTPQDEIGIEIYLSSGAIRGIGKAMASRIVRKFGKDSFRIMEEEPERLAEIKGISMRKACEMAKQMEQTRETRNATIFLQKYGISTAMSVKIYKEYGPEIYNIIQTNPYKLADDISGIGFLRADEIAQKAGITVDSDFRIRGGILYQIQQSALNGHTFVYQEELSESASELLGVETEAVERNYMDLMIDRKIVIREKEGKKQVFSTLFDNYERHTAIRLAQLNDQYDIPEIELEARIRQIESETGIQLDELQVQAVKISARNGLTVITGGPGTGKTTTINTIIRYFEKEGMDIALAAPTGRAAKRMSEATGMEARTIHRLLEVNGGEDTNGFERNEQNPLSYDVIIIDETSMVDITLMYALLKAIVFGTRLILVGDINQLPSVGPGSVLSDIIQSEVCSVIELKKIFRQAMDSDIIMNAHRINKGELISLTNKSKDFFFLKRYDSNRVISVCIQLIRDKLPNYVNAEPFDIQVVTPSRLGEVGVERLNTILQEYLNPKDKAKKEVVCQSVLFREGDKIMAVKNNYKLPWEICGKYGIPIETGEGVFNGDMGVISAINSSDHTIEVLFDDNRKAVYEKSQFEELELAYAITAHKSQGSEYPAVIMPILPGPRMLMNRNVLYTAVTRAKKCVTIVGDEGVFNEMIRNHRSQTRNTSLCDRLREQMEL